ncbi:MAG: glycosyltransferase [Flavobacteriales bacterium]|nr:MAG: glycosyltransferase [Flavobacteriales bacterium]
METQTKPKELSMKNILVCPLDWGLGHATRCVPIIRELQRLGFNVIIGADKNPLALLTQEFPNLKVIVIPGYNITFDEQGSFIKLFFKNVRFYKFIKKEHQLLETILEKNNIDIVISDNRYGLWNKKVKSIIITHQLFIKVPIAEDWAHKITQTLIEKFNDCWIPDFNGSENLSGELTHLKSISFKHHFIGSLSRFQKSNPVDKKFDVLAIISGPEPQRSIFEKLVLEQMKSSKLDCALVSGTPLEEKATINENVTVYPHLNTPKLQQLIEESKVIVCRSGYTSIMDLLTLNKKAILVPTPGQTEQEYLAKYHHKQSNFYTQTQSEFNLKNGLDEVEKFLPNFSLEETLKLDYLLDKR